MNYHHPQPMFFLIQCGTFIILTPTPNHMMEGRFEIKQRSHNTNHGTVPNLCYCDNKMHATFLRYQMLSPIYIHFYCNSLFCM